MKMRKNKYSYILVIQFNCGYGWEDVCEYEKGNSTAYHDLREYRLAGGGAYRLIERRVLNAD